MIKKIFIIVILISSIAAPVKALELEIFSSNAILYNLDENKILYEKNASEKISIASLTKIMTAIVALENIESLDEEVILTYDDFKGLSEANASVAGFYVGEKVTYRDLIYGLMLPSGAEAAKALTRTVVENKEKFIELMNQKCEELHLENTHFVNETGLDEERHYSTVKDVATFFRYALENKDFNELIHTKEYQTSNKRKTFKSTIQKFQERYPISMDYLIGGKTGTTENAGLALASIAYKNGTNYMLVTSRAPNNWKEPFHLYDAKKIYDYFIDNYENQDLIKKDEPILTLKTSLAKQDEVKFYVEKTITKYLPKDYQKSDLIIEYNGKNTILPSMKENTYLGEVTVKYQDEVLLNQDIILNERVKYDLKKVIKKYQNKIIFISIAILLMCILIVYVLKKKKR